MAHLSRDTTAPKMGTRLWWFGQMCATRRRYRLFLSGEGKVSSGFRYLKNHPAEAVARKPKPTRRMTVIRTPAVNVIMLPPWSSLFCVSTQE